MNYLHEKISYIKGLSDGLNINETSKEGKVLVKIVDVLEELVEEIAYIREEQEDINEYIEVIDEDLSDVEDEIFIECEDCFDESDEEFVEED